MKSYWVYILASKSRTLYTGVTNDLMRRVAEHRSGTGSKFTERYRITRLVYCEETRDIRDAIAWEKRIKGWDRQKKIELIESRNPHWEDLAHGWGQTADSSQLRSE
jgi:putative endonuclease